MDFFNFLLLPIKKMISPLYVLTEGSAILLGSALAAGVGAINSLINKRNNDKMYDYQRNAYRYTAEDMGRAGLSPALLASGSASATSSPSLSNPDLGGIGSAIQTAMQIKSNQSIAEKNNATSQAINNANLSASAEIRKKEVEIKEAEKRQIEAQTNDILYEINYKKTYGISSISSDKCRSAMEFIKPVSNAGKKMLDAMSKINDSSSSVMGDPKKFKKFYPTLKSYFNELERDGTFRVRDLTREERKQLIDQYNKLSGKD